MLDPVNNRLPSWITRLILCPLAVAMCGACSFIGTRVTFADIGPIPIEAWSHIEIEHGVRALASLVDGSTPISTYAQPR